jgi:hypothetical protein
MIADETLNVLVNTLDLVAQVPAGSPPCRPLAQPRRLSPNPAAPGRW